MTIKDMTETLGIVVSTDKHLDHLIGITRAARKSGRQVIVFLTNRGVLLTREPGWSAMEGLAEISLCRVSLAAFHLDENTPIPGILPQNFANQARHGELIARADRYLSL